MAFADGQQRRGDAVWRVRFRDRWLYLLILLEFQSRIDARMALRILEYTALLYRELDRQGELGTPGGWPAVLPIVLYNGDAPWTASLRSVQAALLEALARARRLGFGRCGVADLTTGRVRGDNDHHGLMA